jgi:hypothetical protein
MSKHPNGITLPSFPSPLPGNTALTDAIVAAPTGSSRLSPTPAPEQWVIFHQAGTFGFGVQGAAENADFRVSGAA